MTGDSPRAKVLGDGNSTLGRASEEFHLPAQAIYCAFRPRSTQAQISHFLLMTDCYCTHRILRLSGSDNQFLALTWCTGQIFILYWDSVATQRVLLKRRIVISHMSIDLLQSPWWILPVILLWEPSNGSM